MESIGLAPEVTMKDALKKSAQNQWASEALDEQMRDIIPDPPPSTHNNEPAISYLNLGNSLGA